MNKLGLSRMFAALKYPNYRLWFAGQVVSLVGTWMQATAQGYLVYELTHSSAYLGIVGFAGGIPTLLFTLFGGVVADRIPRRKLLIITQIVMMVLAITLAVLTFTDWVQPWHIIILAFLLGVANAFDGPARQSFVVEMVDKADLTNAIALNSSIFNLGTVIGPSVAGLVYAWLGPGWCFTINGISFIAVIGALILMNIPGKPVVFENGSSLTKLKEGLRYVAGEPRVKLLLFYLGMISMFGFGLMTLVPAWAVKILGGDVRTNGLMLSARGVGALVAAMIIAYIGTRQVRSKIWLAGLYTMPVGVFILSWVRWIPGTLLLMAALGWSLLSVANISNALIQSYVPDQLRGRVMGVFILVFQGSMPIGSLMLGGLASTVGEPTTLIIASGVILASTTLTFIYRHVIKTF